MGRKELPDGTKVVAPFELQLGWLVRRYGLGVLGTVPDFKLLGRIDRALAVEYVFEKDPTKREAEDWDLIKAVLAKVEGWQNAG